MNHLILTYFFLFVFCGKVPTQLVKDLDSLTRQQICRELNVPRSLGCDYKTLAALLIMSSTDINLIEKKDNPAEEVLKWWETDDQATVGKLQSLFEEMTRDDLVLILKNRPKGRHLRYINATVWRDTMHQRYVLSSAEKYIHHCAVLTFVAIQAFLKKFNNYNNLNQFI